MSLPRATLAASHSLDAQRGLHGRCGQSDCGSEVFGVRGAASLIKTCCNSQITNSCCYPQTQESLFRDCHREKSNPPVPACLRWQKKPTSKASLPRQHLPETISAWAGMGSKGLVILLLHLFIRYFPQRKSFSFLCFYCKLCAAKRKERKRPTQIERLAGGRRKPTRGGFSADNPFHSHFSGSLCQRHPPVRES